MVLWGKFHPFGLALLSSPKVGGYIVFAVVCPSVWRPSTLISIQPFMEHNSYIYELISILFGTVVLYHKWKCHFKHLFRQVQCQCQTSRSNVKIPSLNRTKPKIPKTHFSVTSPTATDYHIVALENERLLCG